MASLAEGDGEDDLGNFFNEIEEIEKSVPVTSDLESSNAEEKTTNTSKISAPIEIVSKPQIISKEPERPRTVYVAYSGAYTGPASTAAKVESDLS